jgi:hypothetical protein
MHIYKGSVAGNPADPAYSRVAANPEKGRREERAPNEGGLVGRVLHLAHLTNRQKGGISHPEHAIKGTDPLRERIKEATNLCISGNGSAWNGYGERGKVHSANFYESL